jgi:hypothetical protein
MALDARSSIRTAAELARRLQRRIAQRVRPVLGRRARKRRETTKAKIIGFMRSAGGYSAAVGLTSRASIALALHLLESDLQPLLDELVAEKRIFPAPLQSLADYYALVRLPSNWPGPR